MTVDSVIGSVSLTMSYLMSLIQKKIFRLMTRTASNKTPSDRDATAGLKKPTMEKIAARNTDNQKNTENEITNARGIANQMIIPFRKPKPADMNTIAIRSTASGESMSLMLFRFFMYQKITAVEWTRECVDHTNCVLRAIGRLAVT